MAMTRHLETSEVGDVTVVRFLDRRIQEDTAIQEIGRRITTLIDIEQKKKLLLNFANVEIVSSHALGKLIEMHKRALANDVVLKFSNIRPEIYEVLAVTNLNKL